MDLKHPANDMPSAVFSCAVEHLHTLSEVYRNIGDTGHLSEGHQNEILNKLEKRMLSILNALPEGQV
jgi:hypothetical protein